MIIYGINPVFEALRAGRVRRVRVGTRDDRRVEEVIALARESGVGVERVDAPALDRAARGGVHQGVVADLEPPREYSVEELVACAFYTVGLDWRDHVRTDASLFRGRAELHDLVGDATKARETLGWRPEIDFAGLVALLVRADLERLQEERASA